MRACVLLNLLCELGKGDKMGGWQNMLSLFCNDINSALEEHKLLDSIYHMTLKLLEIALLA